MSSITQARPPLTAPQPTVLALPTVLPRASDGRPLQHLSVSSINQLLRCPEQFRRHRIKGEPRRISCAMHLGGSVDDAISSHYRALLDGAPLSAEEVLDRYRQAWSDRLEREEIAWGDDREPELLDTGAACVAVYLSELAIPRPVAVQRRLEHRIAPDLHWTVVGYLDLEGADGDVIDVKVKQAHVQPGRADHDLQATGYLAFREAEGDPARRFVFHSLNRKPAQPGARAIPTERDQRQLAGFWLRVAIAARQLAAYHNRFGPDEPWPFAAPDHWCCSADFCEFYERCPGGAGL
jgi:PD-(D/E)XK nuclease superfamily protein